MEPRAGPSEQTEAARPMMTWTRPLALALGLALLAGSVPAFLSGAMAQEVAKEPPPSPVVENPGRAPSPNAVWISGHWEWRGGRYVWAPGHWETAPPGQVYVPGRYKRVGNGWVYEPGRWRASR